MAGLTGLTQAILQGPDSKNLPKAYLIPTDAAGVLISSKKFEFQYYPDTVRVSNQINYSDKDIPGLSHPLKQWTSNGGRTISFDAKFARDILPQQDLPGAVGLVVNPTSAENKQWNKDVRHSIRQLSSFIYPTYAEIADGVSVATPPPTMLLTLEGLGLDHYGSDTLYVVITGLDTEYVSSFENGIPRVANVSLEFAETIQIGSKIQSWDSANFDLSEFSNI
jgi:hypothetical protein